MPDRYTEPPINKNEISPILDLVLSDGRTVKGFYERHYPCSDVPIWDDYWQLLEGDEYIHPLIVSWTLAGVE